MASGHAPLIKKILFVLEGSMNLHYYFVQPSCCFAGSLQLTNLGVFHLRTQPAETRVLAAKISSSLFPLHVFHYPGCSYFSSLETSSLGAIFEEKIGNQYQRKTILIFGTSYWGSLPSRALPLSTLILFLPLTTLKLAGWYSLHALWQRARRIWE